MRSLILFLASGAYTGYFPVASGTVGTLVAIPLFWAFSRLQAVSVPLYLAVFVAAVVFSCWIADRAEKILQEHDSHKIVIDELAGFLAATLFLAPTWPHTIVAFFAFRAFDVLKPFPASHFDRNVSGGIGVVMDDVVAGFYANLVTRLVFLWVL
jgi:phosphatidylglycerophosphatase A